LTEAKGTNGGNSKKGFPNDSNANQGTPKKTYCPLLKKILDQAQQKKGGRAFATGKTAKEMKEALVIWRGFRKGKEIDQDPVHAAKKKRTVEASSGNPNLKML